MRCALAPIAVLASLLLAGCGTGGSTANDSPEFQGEQKLVQNTVEDLQTAAKDRDGAQICRDLITAALQGEIAAQSAGGKGCVAAVDGAVKDTDAVDLTVRSVTVDGTKATAVVREDVSDDGDDVDRTLAFEKQGGRWKISDLGS
jgi:hypothetical protein